MLAYRVCPCCQVVLLLLLLVDPILEMPWGGVLRPRSHYMLRVMIAPPPSVLSWIYGWVSKEALLNLSCRCRLEAGYVLKSVNVYVFIDGVTSPVPGRAVMPTTPPRKLLACLFCVFQLFWRLLFCFRRSSVSLCPSWRRRVSHTCRTCWPSIRSVGPGGDGSGGDGGIM